jgi:hypothetical protein
MNEESEQATFKNRRGSSNIDLTIVNNQLLNVLKSREISAEEAALIITLENSTLDKTPTTKLNTAIPDSGI